MNRFRTICISQPISAYLDRRAFHWASPPRETRLDLLEVYPDRIELKAKLDHTSLIDYFSNLQEQDAEKHDNPQPLRLFFIDELNFVDPFHLNREPNLELNTTGYWMRQRFGVSPLFFSLIISPNYVVKAGNASLMRMEHGKCVEVDGLYRISSDLFAGDITHVWFSHSLIGSRSSTYVIHGCPHRAKDLILAFTHEKTIPMVLRPLAIDTFLCEYAVHTWCQDIILPRDRLVFYEKQSILGFSPEQTAGAVEELHALSNDLHIIQEELTDVQDRIQYLCGIYQRIMQSSSQTDDPAILDSLEYLSSKSSKMRRWAKNYAERTGIRINLIYNLATQLDSRTNLEIARLSSRIAVSTQQDSSSMITMAAVTMFFLPGTFVSALFSMVFFDTQANGNGSESLLVGSQWWLFPAITIPITILVFVIWLGWRRYRNRMDSVALGTSQLGAFVKPVPIPRQNFRRGYHNPNLISS
ncbi:hypothetical protein M413DRAFT_419836 [Hebeloma cylindrosporum]|uniref:Uncharacterized protein n=1 Tax=Hebeloma cylindrosporum TaxID=76867 RepID=A0A0C3BQD7_HEBCY|nr:hypothetical protein M413DRAFT_419836 [Hebeloma cylindrosporum h7]